MLEYVTLLAMNDTEETENKLGRVAAVAGMSSLPLLFMPNFSSFSFILAGFAMISGLLALNQRPRKLAIVGIVSGSTFVLLFILASFLLGP